MSWLSQSIRNGQDPVSGQPGSAGSVASSVSTDLELLTNLTERRHNVLKRLTEEVVGQFVAA